MACVRAGLLVLAWVFDAAATAGEQPAALPKPVTLPKAVESALADVGSWYEEHSDDFSLRYAGLGEREGEAEKPRMRFAVGVDVNEQDPSAVVYGTNGSPRLLIADSELYSIDGQSGQWHCRRNCNWNFSFAAADFSSPFKVKSGRDRIPPRIDFDPEGFGRMVAGGGPIRCESSQGIGFLSVNSEVNDVLVVLLRGDADAKQYGARWSAVGGITNMGARNFVFCPCITGIPYARAQGFNERVLQQELRVNFLSDRQEQPTLPLGRMDEVAYESSGKMYRAIHRAIERGRVVSGMASTSLFLSAATKQALEAKYESGADEVVNFVWYAELIDKCLDDSVGLFPSELAFPRDAYMRRLRSAYLCGPEATSNAFLVGLLLLQKYPAVASARARLIESLLGLGTPIPEMAWEEITISLKGSFEEAVYRSRVGLPCTDEQLDACVRLLSDESSSEMVGTIAVHTLLLANHTEAINENHLRQWVVERISNQSEIRRQRYLDEVLAFEPMRRKLETLLAAITVPEHIREEIANRTAFHDACAARQ